MQFNDLNGPFGQMTRGERVELLPHGFAVDRVRVGVHLQLVSRLGDEIWMLALYNHRVGVS